MPPTPLYPPLVEFPPTWRRRPVGMQAPEDVVWQLFRRANERLIRTLYFNVHCGTVPGLTDAESADDNRARTAMWAKRVDVVAETSSEVWLIEVKAAVRPSAVGQTLTYKPLLAARKPTWANPRVMLIGAQFDPDALALCGTLGLECYAPPFALLVPRANPAPAAS